MRAGFKRFLRGYDEVMLLSQAEIQSIPWLMIEALIAEAVFPIAATGTFGRMEGITFLQMVQRKVAWMQRSAQQLIRVGGRMNRMTLRTRGHSLLAIVAMLVLARFVIATATTRPAIPPMLAQLASDDPAIRDQAEQQLMALSPEDLLPLRQAIQTALPLHPGEARLLQEIVTHVFLSGENTSGLSDRGFMGVEMKRDEGTDPQIEDDPDFPTGVFIENRLPGLHRLRNAP